MSKLNKIVRVSNDTFKGESIIGYEAVEIDNYLPSIGERALSHSFLMDSYRKIMGRTLTIIDAAISDKQQNKATKDLVRNIFSDEMNWSGKWAYDQELQEKMMQEISEEDIGTPVTIEEALGV